MRDAKCCEVVAKANIAFGKMRYKYLSLNSVVKSDRQPDKMLKCYSEQCVQRCNEYCFIKNKWYRCTQTGFFIHVASEFSLH
jgi:hypothetical protein